MRRGRHPLAGLLRRDRIAGHQSLERDLHRHLLGQAHHPARSGVLVNTVSAPGAALEEALALAQRIAASAPLAVRATKGLVHATVHEDDRGGRAWQRIDEARRRVFASEDAAEGAAAFAEKREPRWRGR